MLLYLQRSRLAGRTFGPTDTSLQTVVHHILQLVIGDGQLEYRIRFVFLEWHVGTYIQDANHLLVDGHRRRLEALLLPLSHWVARLRSAFTQPLPSWQKLEREDDLM
jgi:hypothetical protein